ncbi:hypothetical protein DI53_2606 [Sphingobacterium deserti]|uniref:Uncharacterized protein n=1 Tax=Sphingobacterium deserti TaxID=1229276 RepID=A0A0B8T787_9SPHI|nr:hypothetical protein DI53_2606 [Sphingobacterium deserti]
MVSMGLDTTNIMMSGEYSNKFSTTVFTIPAFVPMSSSRVIPGLRGMPEVITATAEPAV